MANIINDNGAGVFVLMLGSNQFELQSIFIDKSISAQNSIWINISNFLLTICIGILQLPKSFRLHFPHHCIYHFEYIFRMWFREVIAIRAIGRAMGRSSDGSWR